MWTCPTCETANNGESCVVCGSAKPSESETEEYRPPVPASRPQDPLPSTFFLYCTKCRKAFSSGVKYCSICGEPLVTNKIKTRMDRESEVEAIEENNNKNKAARTALLIIGIIILIAIMASLKQNA